MGERRGVGVLAALAPVTMLVVDPAGWFPFGPVKWLAVSVVLLLGGAMVLARAPVRWPPRPLGLAMAALLAWLVLAALVGLDPLYAWVGTPERHLGVLTWGLLCVSLVLGVSLDGERDGKVLAAGLGAACLGVGATAAAEAVGWEPDVFDAGRRLTATFGSSAYLGAATALLVPIALGLAFDHRLPRWLRRVGAVATPLLLVASAGAGARAAWVGLVAAALVTAIGRRDRLGTALRAHPRLTLAGTFTSVVVLIGVLVLTPVGGRLRSIADAGEPGGRGRLDEWRVAVDVVAEHPVTGVGPEGYRIAFSGGVDARYERAHGRLQQPDRAHSGPLDVALAGGIPALLAWIVVLGLVGRSVLTVIRRGSGWIVGVGAGLVAHFTGQLLLFPIAELELLAWLLAGVVLAHGSPPPRIDRGSRAASVGLGAVALVALVAGLTDVVADRRAGDAIAALERGDHRAAVDSARDAADLRPDIVRLHVLAATAIVADEQGLLAGIAELDAALDVSPGDPIVLRDRAQLLVDRAAATLVPAHVSAAEDEVLGLLADDPNNAALWRLAARVAALQDDAPGAQEASERADDLTPPEEPGR